MERVLIPITRRTRRSTPAAPASPVTVLMPGAAAGEWILLRRKAAEKAEGGRRKAEEEPLPPAPGGNETGARETDIPGAATDTETPAIDPNVTRQSFVGLEAAAVNLLPEEDFNLGLPLDFGLIQRMGLPPAEPGEIEEMARIQLEKILPYPIEEVSVAWQTIRQDETDTILSVQAAHQERLRSFCQPLAAHARWPLRVNFHALSIAGGAGAGEVSAILYRELGKMVLGICEAGKLSFVQTLDADTPDDLAAQLPAVLLGAELEGIPTGFQSARRDDRCADHRSALETALGVPVELFRTDPAPEMAASPGGAAGKDLTPPEWRVERQRMLRRARLRRNLILAGAVYLTLLVAAFVVVGVMKLQVGRLDAKLEQANPQIDKIKAAEVRWKSLSPAIDPSFSVAETLYQIGECLPPNNAVRLTLFDQKLGTIEIRGEATNQASRDFSDKIKNHPALSAYKFEASPPVVLPSGSVQFQLAGTRR